MRQLNEHHTFTGMQRDMTISRHPSSFLYDAHNIRLTARGDDTLLTITNEKGPRPTGIEVTGTYLGHCLLGNYLVVFSTSSTIIRSTSAKARKYIRAIDNTANTVNTQQETFQPYLDQDGLVINADPVLPWEPLEPLDPTDPIVPPSDPTTPDDNGDDDIDNTGNEGTGGTTTPTITARPDDYITRIDLFTGESTVLYNGNLGFSRQYPIEAIASYENGNIQKVYWTDGLNQPRVINIVGDIIDNLDSQFDFVRELQLGETVTIQKQLGAVGSFAPGVIQYAFTYFSKYGQESNIFYVSPLLYTSYQDRGGSPEDKVENAFKITVTDLDGNFDYLRIYSIQRTSIDGTPIVKRVQDIGIKDLTNETTSKSFVTSSGTSPTVLRNGSYVSMSSAGFSYYKSMSLLGSISTMKWYGYTKRGYPTLVVKTKNGYVTWGEDSTEDSVIWISSSQFTPTGGSYGYQVCETTDGNASTTESLAFSAAEILLNGVSFLDTGTTGDSIDPTELLFKGGESIIAETLEQKDNTLFLGNIGLTRPQITQTIKSTVKSNTTISQATRTFYPTVVSTSYYKYANQLTAFSSLERKQSVPCGGFKRGDYYRCGIQFQYKDGKWSDPIFLDDVQVTGKPTSSEPTSVTVPILKASINATASKAILDLGYKKARAVVVFPEIQDRVTICQGVTCPTLYTTEHSDTDKDLQAQSSWFFRPNVYSSQGYINTDGTASPVSSGMLAYTDRGVNKDSPTSGDTAYNPEKIRQVEVQGDYEDKHKFRVKTTINTLHSPDIEFDDHLLVLDFIGAAYRKVGKASFSTTMSDIDIQTESPTISSSGSGFVHRAFNKNYSHGIISGLFYEDYSVNDNGSDIKINVNQKSPMKWLVYPWNRTGSLNNDINRPADKGARTAVLKKKVISNLRISTTKFDDNTSTMVGTTFSSTDTPKVFSSDQLSIIKLGDNVYQGNVDTLIVPDHADGMYFAFGVAATTSSNGTDNVGTENVDTAFNSISWWKTFSAKEESASSEGLWKRLYSSKESKWYWTRKDTAAGEKQIALVVSKDQVRMKYKSSPHLVIGSTTSVSADSTDVSVLPILEIIRPGDGRDDKPLYRGTMFGGTSEDALKANVWIPCGEPVTLAQSGTTVYYSYGDTYYQRWDCLKTYPFTPDDINQIVEIGSFMLETRINIDGRYDRNRGQSSNLNMTPQNFNLLNPVYTQVKNFFTYRILDDAYYNISSFPNQITWTKEKQAGADVDLWTNITLASTYDMDGSKGAVISLNTWKDQIFCFQDKGVSNILFNSRVQIPTSDGVPIEISNSYKVDGYRYISDGVGCINKWTISDTPSGLYFMDSVSNHLYHIGENIQDITTVHNMTSWFNDASKNEVISTMYDDVNHDVYLLTSNEALCYSEVLGQFTSFMDYDGIVLIESNSNYVYTMRNSKLYFMFKGYYNNFFGVQKGWDFTFVSNGVDDNTMDFDKLFSTLDYRMDMFNEVVNESAIESVYIPDRTLDYIQVNNEYQDTGEVPLSRLKVSTNPKSYHQKGTNLQKKFRIWRIQVPRNKNSLDRIRNPWCKVKLGSKGENNLKAVLHDINMQYFI